MAFLRAFRALMRRNMVYRRRNWVTTLLEVISPVAFLGILLGIKSAVENTSGFAATDVPPSFPDGNAAYTPPSFQDYVTALQAKRVCLLDPSTDSYSISGMPSQGENWQIPMLKCDSRRCTENMQDALQFCEYSVIGVAGSTSDDEGGHVRALAFEKWIEDSYPALSSVGAAVAQNLNLPDSFKFVQVFDSSDAMSNYVTSSQYGESPLYPKLAMGVVWTGDSPADYSYSLRPNSTNFDNPMSESRPAAQTTPDTKVLFNSYAKNDYSTCIYDGGGPEMGPLTNSCTGRYLYNGVLTIQRLVDDFILQDSGASDKGYFVAQSGVRFVAFPTPSYRQDGFYASIASYGPLLIVLGTLFPVAMMISYVTREKELRQKELMKMMGVNEADIGWSWFVTFYSFSIITASAAAGVSVALYENSNGLLMWIFWMLTFLAFVVFSLFIGSTTSKSVRGIIIGLLIFFIGVFLTLAEDPSSGSSAVISVISLHPVAAFSYGLIVIGNLEDAGVGLQWSSITSSDSPSGFNFAKALTALIFDSVIWGFLTFYLNRVIKPDYGQALPFWFLFKPSYWCPRCARAPPSSHTEMKEAGTDPDIPNEPVGQTLLRQKAEGKSIEIYELRKVFGEKAAIDDLSLSMYSGQITALLGHNGAGKTTTINCLTGALTPTSGYATITGLDTRTQMQTIRQNIGICLQHDCLFPLLTVREHVQFFSRLKGLYEDLSWKEAEAHVDEAIQDVALSEKRNTRSNKLSGGMKRKLSVAIAFCGGSNVVLLDEPTSGMDPFSRRFTWNVIRQYRQSRCIILTTHFMDEADILGDRIAIMAEGRLQCIGSSLYLKKMYGVGYQLTIEKRFTQKPEITEGPRSDNKANTAEIRTEDGVMTTPDAQKIDEKLKHIVMSAVEEASLLTNVGSEMSYQLPINAASKFVPMFEGLDREVEMKTISCYGVSMTTLEEVFLLVAKGRTTQVKELASSKRIDPSSFSVNDVDRSSRSRMDLEKDGLFFRHMGALFKKRAAFFKRDKKAWCCTAILPSLFVLFGFIIFTVAAPNRNLSPVVLNLNDYNPDIKTTPRNPIPFNEPGTSYTCQPGICAYQSPVIYEMATQELYYYCGAQAFIVKNCSISESQAIADRIVDDGASAEAMSVRNILESSESLYITASSFAASRYAAIYFSHDTESVLPTGELYNQTVINTCQSRPGNYSSSCASFGGLGYLIQYNYTALHVSPTFQAIADEALVREALNTDNFNINVQIAPLPITAVEKSYGGAQDAFSAWFLIILSFPFIGGAFASFVVAERQSKAKHLQTVAGVQPSAYWLSTYLWDILNYQIPLWIAIALMFAFQIDVLTTRTQNVVSGVIAILFLYGPASAGFTYCISFAFTSAALCNMSVIIISFLIALGGPVALFIIRLIGSDVANPQPNLIHVADIIGWILRFFPAFNLGNGLFLAINIETVDYIYGGTFSVWNKHVLLYEAVFLAWESVVYLLLAIQLDKWSSNPKILSYWRYGIGLFCCRCFCGSSESVKATDAVALLDDDDVLAEQDRVLNGQANDDLIVLTQLTKRYENGKLAVNKLSLGIAPGEAFGLLGINGAGKTTTMQMLTAEFPPTSGDATLAGFSVTREPEKTRRRIGYCPQFDAHFANLTGREHVELYASIKGVPSQFIKEAALAKLKEVGLSETDCDRLSSGYSGGMKRRLSLACATIGQPQIVFLDECSTGVDPVARREIWQLISDMITGGNMPPEERTSIILTTHSMDECEALCPRIGIMANGRLSCLGSAQHLKNKFGKGYQLELKVMLVNREDEDYIANATKLAATKGVSEDVELGTVQLFFNLEEATSALRSITNDDSLSSHVNVNDEIGYIIWKDATSLSGASLDDVASFCTTELRMKQVAAFLQVQYPNHILRERQDNKARYEVSSEGVRLSQIFADIEANKERLKLSDYGCSQTSLEQVFNSHAAEAEKIKQGRNDG